MEKKKKSSMSYKNGVWRTDSFETMNNFFYHKADQRQIPEPPIPLYAPDHTDAIWDRRFQVEVITIAVKSMESLARRGLIITGIKRIDDLAHERLIYPFLSINEIIEVENNGYDVNYTSYKTLIDIYHCVKTYIEFWTDKNNEESHEIHNFTSIPSEDISRIESYMDSIYPLVSKSVDKPERTWSSMMNRFMILDTSITQPKVVSVKSTVLENQGLPNTLGEV